MVIELKLVVSTPTTNKKVVEKTTNLELKAIRKDGF
jgi:hypothetical protein